MSEGEGGGRSFRFPAFCDAWKQQIRQTLPQRQSGRNHFIIPPEMLLNKCIRRAIQNSSGQELNRYF
jgi:hypothetical protein